MGTPTLLGWGWDAPEEDPLDENEESAVVGNCELEVLLLLLLGAPSLTGLEKNMISTVP